ncbi:Serine/arginine repetitive matrix protein 1 [Madurella fahalii]|uniref:Serine/arginine repetitive matrix protein 1 n=1 Tax=Madurella fahalii TaxID=1157608 RepID=A0ABQ0G6I1_9PEZI
MVANGGDAVVAGPEPQSGGARPDEALFGAHLLATYPPGGMTAGTIGETTEEAIGASGQGHHLAGITRSEISEEGHVRRSTERDYAGTGRRQDVRRRPGRAEAVLIAHAPGVRIGGIVTTVILHRIDANHRFPGTRGREDRSGPQSPARSHVSNAPTPISAPLPTREVAKPPAPSQPAQPAQSTPKPPAVDVNSTPVKSPPRGPAALRAPPTGPAATRNFTAPAAPQAAQAPRHPQPPSGPSRPGTTSPTVPPAGPRGYVPPRGGGAFAGRGGGRGGGGGGWSSGPTRHISGSGASSVSPTVPPTGPSAGPASGGIPTGPRAQTSSTATASPPFNPPTGPAALGLGIGVNIPPQRPTLAQSLMNTMPPIVPGGKIDPSAVAPVDMDPHHRKLREEEERLREELRVKQDKLRKSLRMWDRLERESKGFELKSDLSERSLENIAGEGLGGAAF